MLSLNIATYYKSYNNNNNNQIPVGFKELRIESQKKKKKKLEFQSTKKIKYPNDYFTRFVQ